MSKTYGPAPSSETPRCMECGQSLVGLPDAGACPECGVTYTATSRFPPQKQPLAHALKPYLMPLGIAVGFPVMCGIFVVITYHTFHTSPVVSKMFRVATTATLIVGPVIVAVSCLVSSVQVALSVNSRTPRLVRERPLIPFIPFSTRALLLSLLLTAATTGALACVAFFTGIVSGMIAGAFCDGFSDDAATFG